MKTYEDGLNEAWEAARKIVCDDGYDWSELAGMFEKCSTSDILKTNTASEAIDKIKNYEEKIKVGDEVEYISTADRGVVEHISKFTQTISVMWDNGSIGEASIKKFKKTGRHFPQIEEVLKLMQKDKYD